jgi:hypothetical protein
LKKALKEGANVNEEDNAGKKIKFSIEYHFLFILGWTPLHEGNLFANYFSIQMTYF